MSLLTEADLPRGLDDGDIRDPELAAKVATPAPAAATCAVAAKLAAAGAPRHGEMTEEELIEAGH